MTRVSRQRRSAGRLFLGPVASVASCLGVTWLGGFTAATGTGMPLWAVAAAGAVVGATAGVGLVLAKVSHGGDWGRNTARAEHLSWH